MSFSKTATLISQWKYDPTALIGIFIGALPDIISMFISDPEYAAAPAWLKWTVRIIGILVAAQGRPLVVNAPKPTEPPPDA